MRLPLFLAAALLAGCSQIPAQLPSDVPDAGPTATVAGSWTWTCCDGRYTGSMTLRQAGSQLSGSFRDEVDRSAGDLTGTVQGSTVRMTRTTPSTRQNYTLRVSADGRRLTGTFTGSGASTPAPFEARRVDT